MVDSDIASADCFVTEPITVLLADDHAGVRDRLRVLLEQGGEIQVVGVCGDGRSAVDEAYRLRPRVVVTDIAMPELSGIDATTEILRGLPGTKVVILSMHCSSEHIYRALQAGVLGSVLKDLAGTEIVQAVKASASGQRYLSSKILDAVVEGYLRKGRPKAPSGK
jgi:DNA-binding NarL/FixJ family response regulator